MPRPQRLTLALPEKLRRILELRGAHSDRTRGPFNYTRQLTRTLELYEQVFVASDPRETAKMSEDDYQLVLEALTDPLALESFHIAHLGSYLADLPGFRARARERGIEIKRLRDLLNGYSFSEQVHLVDAALIRNALPRHK